MIKQVIFDRGVCVIGEEFPAPTLGYFDSGLVKEIYKNAAGEMCVVCEKCSVVLKTWLYFVEEIRQTVNY